MDNPNQLLADLVKALDSAYISSWQSTAQWAKQLDAARDYVAQQKCECAARVQKERSGG